MKKYLILFLICVTVHFKNGEVKSFPFRRVLGADCGFLGGCNNMVELYNNDYDNMKINSETYLYYEVNNAC